MPLFRTLIAIICTVLGAPLATAQVQSPELPSQLSLQQVRLPENKSLYFIRAPLNLFDVRVLSPMVGVASQKSSADPERAARGFFLQDYLRRFSALAVSSGGYIESYSPPTALGLVKSDGIIVSREHSSWLTEAVFCSDSGRAIIEVVGPSADRAAFRDCLQAGPLIVYNGRIPIDLPSRRTTGFQKLSASVQEQCFLCLDANQHVLIGVADKMDLNTLSSALMRPEVGCVNALRLTGQDTAGLRTKNNLYGNDDYLFPNAVGVLRRPK